MPQPAPDDDRDAIARIEALKRAYFHALDAKDWDRFADLFTADCVYAVYRDPDDGAPKQRAGRDAIVASIRRTVGSATTVHRGTPLAIEIGAAGRASAIWEMTDSARFDDADTPRSFAGAGRYHEDYVFADGQWRISRLVLRRAWSAVA